MNDLDEDQKAKVREAMKHVTDAVAAIEGDLAQVLTEEQMEKFRSMKEAGSRRGMGNRRGSRAMMPPSTPDETKQKNIE